ncbi:hypothetical protein HWV62_25276, partial [Athelia sp. TMB]
LDGDGRPISLTLSNVTRGVIQDFRIVSPPFWSNTVSDSLDVVYDGMYVNATNTNTTSAGQNIVPNTDGIDTYRAKNIQLTNWDVTCGDDAIAIKGNSTNIAIKNLVIRGGNGVAFGSLGQYYQFPNMANGVYFKSWDDTVNGLPPTSGGGGGGYCRDVTLKDFYLNNVSIPTQIYQANGGKVRSRLHFAESKYSHLEYKSGDTPSYLKFSNISWTNWQGTTVGTTLVDLACSSNALCGGMLFRQFDVKVVGGANGAYKCSNTLDVTGIADCSYTE